MDKIVTHIINVIANNHQKNLKLNNPAPPRRSDLPVTNVLHKIRDTNTHRSRPSHNTQSRPGGCSYQIATVIQTRTARKRHAKHSRKRKPKVTTSSLVGATSRSGPFYTKSAIQTRTGHERHTTSRSLTSHNTRSRTSNQTHNLPGRKRQTKHSTTSLVGATSCSRTFYPKSTIQTRTGREHHTLYQINLNCLVQGAVRKQHHRRQLKKRCWCFSCGWVFNPDLAI